jgi:hypothetical protein
MSAKIEQWTQPSAVAMANKQLSRVLLLPSKVKQKSRKLIKQLYGTKSLQYRLMAMLVYLVVRESLDVIDMIVIDKDYSGEDAEATIRNLLLLLLRKDKPNATAEMIHFGNVKGSNADRLAKEVYDGRVPANRTIQYGELEQLLRK